MACPTVFSFRESFAEFGRNSHHPENHRHDGDDFSDPEVFLETFWKPESSDRAVAVESASSAFLTIAIPDATGAALPFFSLRRLCLMWLRCVRRQQL